MHVSPLAVLLLCSPLYLAAWLFAGTAARALLRAPGRLYRFARHQMVIRRAMLGFDRNARKLLSAHSGKCGNARPSAYNDPDSP